MVNGEWINGKLCKCLLCYIMLNWTAQGGSRNSVAHTWVSCCSLLLLLLVSQLDDADCACVARKEQPTTPFPCSLHSWSTALCSLCCCLWGKTVRFFDTLWIVYWSYWKMHWLLSRYTTSLAGACSLKFLACSLTKTNSTTHTHTHTCTNRQAGNEMPAKVAPQWKIIVHKRSVGN